MARDYKPADLSKLNTYSIGKRAHKFDVRRLAGLPAKGAPAWSDLPEGCRLLVVQLAIEFEGEGEKMLGEAVDGVLAK